MCAGIVVNVSGSVGDPTPCANGLSASAPGGVRHRSCSSHALAHGDDSPGDDLRILYELISSLWLFFHLRGKRPDRLASFSSAQKIMEEFE